MNAVDNEEKIPDSSVRPGESRIGVGSDITQLSNSPATSLFPVFQESSHASFPGFKAFVRLRQLLLYQLIV
jgi:hypothetical protein